MTIYRNNYRSAGWTSHGYSYHSNKREALLAARSSKNTTKDNEDGDERIAEVETLPIMVEPTKAGIIRLLNRYAAHNDNG